MFFLLLASYEHLIAPKPDSKTTDLNDQFMKGVNHYLGEGVPANQTLAFEFFKPAADAGHVIAQYIVAAMYMSGSGVPENKNSAIEYFRKAAY